MPAIPDFFSKYKDPANIKVSTFRKVAHSATNKVSSMTKKDVVVSLVEQGNTAVGVMTFASSIAVAAGSTAAFATAMTGPAAGIALGVVGIALAAKAMYSNREAAHNTVTPYMFSLIDAMPPAAFPSDKSNRDKLGGAALALITDGQAQVAQGASKLQTAETAFNNFWQNDYKTVAEFHRRYATAKTPQNKKGVLENEAKRQSLITNAEKSGGAIFEYMRRLVHFGNYLQVFELFGKILKNDSSWTPNIAFGAYFPTVRSTRSTLATILARVNSDNLMYDDASR